MKTFYNFQKKSVTNKIDSQILVYLNMKK